MDFAEQNIPEDQFQCFIDMVSYQHFLTGDKVSTTRIFMLNPRVEYVDFAEQNIPEISSSVS